MENIEIRHAVPGDEPLILEFIRELADYEHMLDEVVATEALLREWLFERRAAEVVFAVAEGKEVGFALFFGNFSTFLGRGGIYLEDLFVKPEHRGTAMAGHCCAIWRARRSSAAAAASIGPASTGTSRA